MLLPLKSRYCSSDILVMLAVTLPIMPADEIAEILRAYIMSHEILDYVNATAERNGSTLIDKPAI